MIDSDDSFGEGWNQADLDETNPAHESLRKITFAPDITVQAEPSVLNSSKKLCLREKSPTSTGYIILTARS